MNVVRENSAVSGRKKRQTNIVIFYVEISNPPTTSSPSAPVDFGDFSLMCTFVFTETHRTHRRMSDGRPVSASSVGSNVVLPLGRSASQSNLKGCFASYKMCIYVYICIEEVSVIMLICVDNIEECIHSPQRELLSVVK
jgi:hypothetical protein